jgi:hypothetical protein
VSQGTNVLDEAKGLVEKRLAELDGERQQLERALKELGGNATGKRSPGRRSSASSKPGPRRRQKRRSGAPTRGIEMLDIIGKQPGAGTSDIAKAMKIKPNYLYRLAGDAEREGLVRKDGRQLFLTEKGEQVVAEAGTNSSASKPETHTAKASKNDGKGKGKGKGKAAKKTTSA